ncbi:27089_t:CDS:2 [Dentiscutata erythropus]|uniref:27089_t:CDS:1 n=1 Tax=Dentiscutata erythropus TaxID=1348616 RepID=A0A9N8Z1G2_9GLOM|nr:27089_t:CDS:2 [Dentiscutata erythropus]
MAYPKTYTIPLPKNMHDYFSSAPFITCTFIKFLRRLDSEQILKSTEQRSIHGFYIKILNSLSVDLTIPQFAQNHSRKLIKKIRFIWDSIAEREKHHAAEEHDYKLLEQVRDKHVIIGHTDVARVQEKHTDKKRKDEDDIESTPPTKKITAQQSYDDDEDDEISIIKDIPQLSLENRELEALTSIFMLTPNSHSEMIINIFGSQNLDKIHKTLFSTDKRELDAKCEFKFRRIIKQSINDSRDSAIKSTIAYLTEINSKENLGFIILEGLKLLPNLKLKSQPSEMSLITNYLDYIMKELLHEPDKHRVEWPNTGLKESRARKLEGRARQPDFIVSVINQLETSGTLFVGEVTSPAEKGNVYKNCNNLVHVGVFMKECIDSAIDKGADVKLLEFQCIEYTIDFYAMELSAPGLYFMYYIGQASIPTSVKTMTHFIDDIETFLTVRDIFRESFVNFYDKLRNPKEQSTKVPFKCETLSTPSFNRLVSNTRNVNRKCSFWFGRF